MSHTTDGGGGASVELDLDALRKIGNDTAHHASGATTARRAVAGTDGGHGVYSSYPAAQTFAAHHDAVSAVFTDTLSALRQEMQEFGETITNVVRRYEDTDEKVETALGQIAATIAPSGKSDTETAYARARHDQGDRLPEKSDEPKDDGHGHGGGHDGGGQHGGDHHGGGQHGGQGI